MRIKPIGLVFSVVLALPPAKAEFIISIQQDGANVVATGSGSIDTAGLTKASNTFRAADYDLVNAKFANYGAGVPGEPVTLFTQFSGLSGPLSFGAGDTTNASTSSGSSIILVGKVTGGGPGIVDLPEGYVAGSFFSNVNIFNNKTLDALGLTLGTYTYTFGNGADADSIVVQIGPVAPSLDTR
jgi:hypothetical protein